MCRQHQEYLLQTGHAEVCPLSHSCRTAGMSRRQQAGGTTRPAMVPQIVQAHLWAPMGGRCRCRRGCQTRTCGCTAGRSTTAPWPSSAAPSAPSPAPTSRASSGAAVEDAIMAATALHGCGDSSDSRVSAAFPSSRQHAVGAVRGYDNTDAFTTSKHDNRCTQLETQDLTTLITSFA
jgi:hypothetical protein